MKLPNGCTISSKSIVAVILLCSNICKHLLHTEYPVAGTSPEGDDVRDYAEVGVTNMAVATGLVLKDGVTYYVTVRGEWSAVPTSLLMRSGMRPAGL